MLTGYSRVWQDGIEPLENYIEPIKDEKTSHCYFDPFRVTLQYQYNEKDHVSGVGVLIFAPNGLIWLQTNIYCFELDKFASYYYAIEQLLEEADKSKAKNLMFYVDDKDFAHAVTHKKPYKSEPYNKVHAYVIDKLQKYESYRIDFRDTYPKEVMERLRKEASEGSQVPLFDQRGYWQNQPGKMYFNIKTPTGAEEKEFAEGLARIYLDFFEDYMKEYKEEIGEEKFKQFVADVNAGKIKKLPDTKRVKANKRKTVMVKNFPKLKLSKPALCQNCQTEMIFEACFMEYPEKELQYHFRCKKCNATKILNSRNRVISYGKYPKKQQ